MNYRIVLDGIPRIVKTGAAVDDDVFGELYAAREALKVRVRHDIATLRVCCSTALATREGDLLSEVGDRILSEEPSIDIPPAPSGQGDDTLPDEPVVRHRNDDLTDIPPEPDRRPRR